MSFQWPGMLLLLLLAPLLGGFYLWMTARRRRRATDFGPSGGSGSQGENHSGRRHIPMAIFLIGLSLLAIALARPQAVTRVPRLKGTVILAFDVSGSMAAEDLNPNRMEAAKAAGLSFVEAQPGSVQVGIVAFSDSGFAVQAPTSDQQALKETIARLEPQRGTSLANGILAALNTIHPVEIPGESLYSNLTPTPPPTPTPVPEGVYEPAVLVLLTDGENNEAPDPLYAARMAADRGVRIFTVGVGSPEGAILNVDGFMIHTSMDESKLRKIAEISGGVYFNAQNHEELTEIYQNIGSQLEVKSERMEVTSIFAGSSIFILLLGAAISMLWLGRFP